MILSDPVYDVDKPPIRRRSIEPAITPPAVPSPVLTPTKEKPAMRRKSTGFTDVISIAAKEIENQIKARRKSAPPISPPPSHAGKDGKSPSPVSAAGEPRESLAELRETRRQSLTDEKSPVAAAAQAAEVRRSSLTNKGKEIPKPVFVKKTIVIPPLALKGMNRLGDPTDGAPAQERSSVSEAPRDTRASADSAPLKKQKSSADAGPLKRQKSKKRERVKRPNLGVAGGGKETADSPVSDDAGDEREGRKSTSEKRSTSERRTSEKRTSGRRRSISANEGSLSEGEGGSDDDSSFNEDSQQAKDHEAELRELGLLLPPPEPAPEATEKGNKGKGNNKVDPRKNFQKDAKDGQKARDSFCVRFFSW